MKKFDFSFRMLTLIICTAIAINFFYVPTQNTVSAAETEMRGVWVTTVGNQDYPKTPTTDAWELRVQLDEILDNCEDMGFNTIFFQVRPSGDALYKSSIYPWSYYLTGTQGLAPSDDFDPLEYAIKAAHDRGMQLHAWINPYRVTNSSQYNDKLASNNPAVLRPDLVLTDSTGKMYLNPGEADSIDIILDGIREIVQNYDVDGIHMDDYFYPSSGFDDSAAYYKYQSAYPDKAEWRRSMVTTLIACAKDAVKEINPNCMFGISPSGIWANSDTPGGSNTNGSSSYHKLYADTKLWVEREYLDYIMPQIYWHNGHQQADYATLIIWWANVCAPTNVKLYIGEAAYKAASGSESAWKGQNGLNELSTQVNMCRESDYIGGYSMFAYSSFRDNASLYNLIKDLQSSPAEPPTLVGSSVTLPDLTDEPKSDDVDALPNDSDNTNYETEPSYLPTLAPTHAPTLGRADKFTDMGEYDWAMTYISELVDAGIVNGMSETEFGPDINVSRADATVLLYRILKSGDVSFDNNFDDVYKNAYYYDEIGQAKASGIAWGIGNNLFNPDGKMLRQDMATLAYRVLKDRQIMTAIPNTAKALNIFSDWMNIDFYARDAVAACVEHNLMSGYGDSTIRPKGYATRVEIALFMQRIKTLIDAQ